MKAILISIKPRHNKNILNLIKTLEIRKKFPKDYVGWVYIYCTKDKNLLRKVVEYDESSMNWYQPHYEIINDKNCDFDILNGKVVARFWCDKVEKIRSYLEPEQWYMTNDLGGSGLLRKSCLTFKELDDYLLSGEGYAIHIGKLEIFNKPKEISDFYKAPDEKYAKWCRENSTHGLCIIQSLTRAPQSYCYVEVVR